MPRKPRREPKLDPLDEFSSWNKRIAVIFFLATFISTLIILIGIWVSIFIYLAEQGILAWMATIELGYIIAIIMAIIALHLFVAVLFYILFKGSHDRLLKMLFKDRMLAKKYEDYSTLRILIGLLLWAIFISIVALIIALLPAAFGQALATMWDWMIKTFNAGQWILWFGCVCLSIVGIFFMLFVLWNKGVYWVLKRIKTIEEEKEIEEEIEKEALRKADKQELYKIYKKETGKSAVYRGKETKGFIEWKKKRLS
ncbi:MAG: hypothetical protein ACP6IY_14260 [Promethearchaeia archaeon]